MSAIAPPKRVVSQPFAGTPAHDLCELTGFIGGLSNIPSFDERSERELLDTAMDHGESIERERAAWEYADRRPAKLAHHLHELFLRETRPSIRWNLLWLSTKTCDTLPSPLFQSALHDPDSEVRDWARVFLNELTDRRTVTEYTRSAYSEEGEFDQTLPLQISGSAVLRLPTLGCRRVTLSPLWFEHIMGRVTACTNIDSFMRDLVIEKCLEGYHPDKSDHYEIYHFAGAAWGSPETGTEHRYQSYSLRPFYRSGRVEDKSRIVDKEIPIILNRGASCSACALRADPERAPRRRIVSSDATPPATDARAVRLLNGRVVETVRGQFFGWAHTSVEQYARAGRVLPGTVQLTNPLHPATAEATNSYLCGTFRGKLGDYDGDGRLDINLIPCHGDASGKLDYHADGSHAADPFS